MIELRHTDRPPGRGEASAFGLAVDELRARRAGR